MAEAVIEALRAGLGFVKDGHYWVGVVAFFVTLFGVITMRASKDSFHALPQEEQRKIQQLQDKHKPLGCLIAALLIFGVFLWVWYRGQD